MDRSEKRGAFDWYLLHLGTTAMTAGGSAAQGGGARNPIAVAALEQCAAMSYTNALPALEDYAAGNEIPARKEAMELVFRWHALDDWLVEFARDVVTNDAKYSDAERNLAGRRLCDVLRASSSDGGTNSAPWNTGVRIMYENRTNRACAVAVDGLLVACVPDYERSADRLEAARILLADTNTWSNCRSYFIDVTNAVTGAGQ